MREIAEMDGSCVCCLEWYPNLRRWKVSVVPGVLDWLRICQPCRNLPREQLTDTIRFNIDHHLYPEDCPALAPSAQELGAARRRRERRHLRVVTDGDR